MLATPCLQGPRQRDHLVNGHVERGVLPGTVLDPYLSGYSHTG